MEAEVLTKKGALKVSPYRGKTDKLHGGVAEVTRSEEKGTQGDGYRI